MKLKYTSRADQKSSVSLRFFKSAKSGMAARTGGAVSEGNVKELGLKRIAYWAGFGSMHRDSENAFKRFDKAKAEAEAFLESQRQALDFQKQ